MNTGLLLEIALRSLLMGGTIFATLRLLRIRQIRAQRAAWLFALFGALAMPALVGWHIGPRLLPQVIGQDWFKPAQAVTDYATAVSATSQTALTALAPSITTMPGPLTDIIVRQTGRKAEPAVDALSNAAFFGLRLYLAITAMLLLRLVFGLCVALRLRGQARHAAIPFAAQADIRISSRITTPVTVGSSILLPETCSQWDEATLQIVLTHELAHVRQADFFVQWLAGLHCALFWFSPFSWWLHRRLSDLGEALSDLAAVQQAESRASYAEVLLAFATSVDWPLTGIAMAAKSNLAPRIDRLLSDQLFRQSYAGQRRLSLIAMGVVAVAMAFSTSVERVDAAQTEASPASPATAPDPTAAPTPLAPAAAPSPPSVSDLEKHAMHRTEMMRASKPPLPPLPPLPSVKPLPPVAPFDATAALDSPSHITLKSHTHTNSAEDSSDDGFSYINSNDGEVLALVSGKSEVSFDGPYNETFQRIRPTISGDFIYYLHSGKAFILQDAALLDRAKSLYAPMQGLTRAQNELGQQEKRLSKQQEELGQRQSNIKLPTPALQKELASLDDIVRKMKNLKARPTVDPEALADLQARLGDIQGQLGELQSQAGERQGELGEQQGALGELQGKLGEQQGHLGEQQSRLAEDAQRQLKPLIEQAIVDGKARPVR